MFSFISFFFVLAALYDVGCKYLSQLLSFGDCLWCECDQWDAGLFKGGAFGFVAFLAFFFFVRWAVQFNRKHDAGVVFSAQQKINAFSSNFAQLGKASFLESGNPKDLRHADLRKGYQRGRGFVEPVVEREFAFVEKLKFVPVGWFFHFSYPLCFVVKRIMHHAKKGFKGFCNTSPVGLLA